MIKKCFDKGNCHHTAEREKYREKLEGQKPSWQEGDNEEESKENESLITLNKISAVSTVTNVSSLLLQTVQLN